MQRWRRIALWSGGGVLAALALLLLFGMFLLWTAPGHRLAASIVERATGGQIRIEGLGGDLPNHPHVDRVEISDAKGLWLQVDDATVDWSIWSLIQGPITVSDARAALVTVLRRPQSSSSTSEDTAFAVRHFSVARVALSAALVGHAASLRAEGSVRYADRRNASADVSISEIGGDGRYTIRGAIDDGRVSGTAHIGEGGQGLIGKIAGLPDLGPVTLDAIAGAQWPANRIAVVLGAGALVATGNGTVDLDHASADITLDAHAPAMRPGDALAWDSLDLRGRMQGTFDAPRIDATIRIANFVMQGVHIQTVDGLLRGTGGTGDFNMSLEQVTLPGPEPKLLGNQAVIFAGHVDFAASTRPVDISIIHPLLRASGRIETAGSPNGRIRLVLPLLGPLASAAGIALDGEANGDIAFAMQQGEAHVTLDGRMSTEPENAVGRIIGRGATLKADLVLKQGTLAALHAQLQTVALSAKVDGADTAGKLDYRFETTIANVGNLAPRFHGSISLNGTATGPADNVRLAGTAHGMLGLSGTAPERTDASFHVEGLPKPQSGALTLRGRFGGAPVTILASLSPERDGLRATLDTLQWKSLQGKGAFALTRSGALRSGDLALRVGRLGDATALAGLSMDGAVDAKLTLGAGGDATVAATASDVRLESTNISRLRIDGTIAQALSRPAPALTLQATEIDTGNIKGDATIRVAGPIDKLELRLAFDGNAGGGALQASAQATADLDSRHTILSAADGHWKGTPFSLTRPASFDLSKGVSVDRLDAQFAGAQITIAGRLTPALSAKVSVENLGPEALRAGGIQADGVLSATAQLTGTLASPAGTFEIEGHDLSIGGPKAQLDLRGTLAGTEARIAAKLSSGSAAALDLTGTVPLSAKGEMNLHASGTADLALLTAYTAATGQAIAGSVSLDMRISGAPVAPRLNGRAQLSNGSLSDFAHSFRLRDITAELVAEGTKLRVTGLSAKARRGSVTGSGEIDLGAPGIPIDISIKASNAQPITSDRLTAQFDADLKLSGKLRELTTLSGTVTIDSGEIDLPKRLAADVPTLNVRRRGEAAQAREPAAVVALNIALDVPDHISLRGRGLESELSGSLKVSGTTGAPIVLGELTMRRGTLSIAGHTLDIQSGAIGFNGSSLRSRIDPTLDFTAQTASGGVTATLKITGYASQPVIVLTSTPDLPQDEVLARLLFQTSVKQLSPVQIAELAQAIPALTGIGEGFDPVDSLRRSLGLDRLAVGSADEASGGGTTVEVGRHVAAGLYVGARQNLSGGTRAVVQYDLTKNLKLEATVNTGTAATPSTATQDNGSSVGITYQFDY
ncbi:MAG: translocation/assembly module TamB domain-containing protein [Proteobacteria bacterium]|nr:translocation/assembly module TamB domain-containing protein [Pseudomonadota bacterium]